MQATPAHPKGPEIVPNPSSAATPTNPKPNPRMRQNPRRSCTPKNRCMSAIDRGTMAMSMPVTEELIQRSPTEISANGTTNSAIANAKIATLCPPRDFSAPRRHAIGTRTKAASVTRPKATVMGESSATASLMKKYGRPQMMLSAAKAPHARQLTSTPSASLRRCRFSAMLPGIAGADLSRRFHRQFCPKAHRVARGRRHRKHAACTPEGYAEVVRGERSVHLGRIPLIRVSHIVDGQVVVLAPEERDGVEPLTRSKHVHRRDLPLALSDHPVLDADALTGVRVRPPRNVACGEHSRSAGLQIFVHRHPAIDIQSGLLGQSDRGPHSRAQDQKIRIDDGAVAQGDPAAVHAADGVSQMESHAVRLVQRLDELSRRFAENTRHRHLLGADDVNLEAACAQRSGCFQADEARAHDDYAAGGRGLRDDGA